jgi:MFS family permease
MAVEIAAIPPLSLVLGHPVYAVAAVLATLLVCSGVGSMWSDRFNPNRRRRVGIILAVMLAAGAVCLWPLAHALETAPLPLRLGGVLVALVPLGLLMGMPFPLGLRSLAPGAGGIAWAWASNGFASVVAAPLGALVAIEAGTNTLLFLAAAAYALGATIQPRARAGAHPEGAPGATREDES